MIKIVLAFLVSFAICWFGIKGYRELTLKDKWSFVKITAYSILCATLAMVFLTVFVVLF